MTWIGPESGSTETDSFGDYAAPGLLAGSYTFVVSYSGCRPDSAKVEVSAGASTVQDFHLQC